MKVSFAVEAGTWCVYLESTQVYITQNKPTKPKQMILKKDLTKELPMVLYQRSMTQHSDLMEVEVRGSHGLVCEVDT
jgi:hypothetical protein